MKILNKFLPIATIGCTALAIAPFATSCSKKNGIDIQEIIKGEYERKTNIAGEGTKTEAEITGFYVAAIKENKQIFADDIYVAMSELLSDVFEDLDANAITGTAQVSLDNIKEDTDYGYRISSDWDVSVEADNLAIPTLQELSTYNEDNNKINGKLNAHLKLTNLPFSIVYEDDGELIVEPHWNMECLTEQFIEDDIWDDTQWSIDMLIDANLTIGSTPLDVNLSTVINYKAPSIVIELVITMLSVMYNGLHMEYLDNITIG